jgi:hypothetical protein
VKKVFWGERQTTYTEAKTEVLRLCSDALYPVLLVGRAAQYLRCGLIEAENLLESMTQDGTLRYATKAEATQAGVGFGYVVT